MLGWLHPRSILFVLKERECNPQDSCVVIKGVEEGCVVGDGSRVERTLQCRCQTRGRFYNIKTLSVARTVESNNGMLRE
jgi:hypothetical protein